MTTEIKITNIKTVGETIKDYGKEFPKSRQPGSRYRYEREVGYLLENNTCLFTTARAETKPKLTEKISRLQNAALRGGLFAQFNEAGAWWGTVMKCRL